MASERELKIFKEETLYEIIRTKKEMEKNPDDAKKYLRNWEMRARSGMSDEEINAVSYRVDEALREEK